MAAYIFSSAALLFSVISFFVLLSYVKKRTAIERIPDETRKEVSQFVSQMINDIDRITDRDAQLVEERVGTLKSVLQDVDKRIALYENQIYFERGRQKRSDVMIEKLLSENTEAAVETNDKNSDIGKRAAALNAAGVPVEEIAKRLKTSIAQVEVALFMYQENR